MSTTPPAWASLRLLPRAVWWLAGANFVNRMGAMVFPFLVLYFNRHLHLSLETAAAIAAYYGVGSAVAAPTGGWLSDRFDAVKVFAFSLLSAGSLMAFFPWLDGYALLAAATFLMALLTDISRPAALTALARLGGSEQSREAFNLNYMAINLGMSVGPLLGGYLALHDYRYLFWGNSVSSLSAGLMLVVSGARCEVLAKDGEKPGWNVGKPAFLAVFWTTVAIWAFMTFFVATPVYVVKVLQRPESWVGWIWLLNTGIIVLTTVQFTYATRGRSLRQLLAMAAVCFAVGYAAFWALPGMGGLLACILALTVGEMLLFTNVSAYLQKVVSPRKMGRAMALNSIAISLGIAASAPAVGHFFGAHRHTRLWLWCMLAALLAGWGYSRLPAPEKAAP